MADGSATPPRPSTPIMTRPLTPTSPAAMEASPGVRTMGTFFPEESGDGGDRNQIHECPVCLRPFSLVRFKHRCKACDRNVCNDCSKSRLRLDDMGLEGREMKKGYMRKDRGNKSSRVCDPCARSYFESKLEADTVAMPVPSLEQSPLVRSTSASPNANASAFPSPADVAPRIRHATGLLRRRHYAFFALFGSLLVLRAMLPSTRPGSSSALPIGVESASNAIRRMTRLDVFGVGLLVLIAIDEWLYFQRVRSNKRNSQSIASTTLQSVPAPTSIPLASPQESEEDLSEAPIKVDMDVDNNDQVSLDKLSRILTDTAAEGANLGIISYLSSSSETSKLLVCFGKATSFAGSTVSGYIDSIEANLNGNAAFSPPGTLWRETKPSLQAVVDKEIELGVATSGGKKHPSISRSVLRLIWFLDFVETILRVLIESASDDIGQGVSKAYEATLGTRHPWLIRKGVMTALGSCPTKSTILSQMNSKQADVIVHLQEIQQQMKLVIDTARGILTDRDLMDIK